MDIDYSLENLIDLDGTIFVINEKLGLWVKFEAFYVSKTNRKNGIRYSLTLHDKNNHRILGFDNAHPIEYGAKKYVAPKVAYDHWHYDRNDKGRPYCYINVGKLMEDSWREVDKRVKQLEEEVGYE